MRPHVSQAGGTARLDFLFWVIESSSAALKTIRSSELVVTS